MIRTLIFITALIGCATLGAQNRWAYGIDAELGASGEADRWYDEEGRYIINSYQAWQDGKIKLRPGASVGVWAEHLILRRLGLRIGINYADLRGAAEYSITRPAAPGGIPSYRKRDRNEFRQTMLRAPVEFKYYTGNRRQKNRLFLSIGGQGGYLLSQSGSSHQELKNISTSDYTSNRKTERLVLNDKSARVWRMQGKLVTGLGITTERYHFSIQRTWGMSDNINYSRPGLRTDIFYFDPSNSVTFEESDAYANAPQLNMTSVRLSYRIY